MAAAKAVGLGGVGAALSAEDVLAVARGAPCTLDAAALEKLDRDEGAQKARAARGACAGRGARRV